MIVAEKQSAEHWNAHHVQDILLPDSYNANPLLLSKLCSDVVLPVFADACS